MKTEVHLDSKTSCFFLALTDTTIIVLCSFVLQISRFTEIILEQDNDEEYKYFRVEEDPARPTLLHLAAERNFLHVAKLLTETYPSLLYLETEEVSGERAYLPVEKALLSYQDETAAYLISQMKHDWLVKTAIMIRVYHTHFLSYLHGKGVL